MSQQPNDRRETKTDRHGMRRERDVLLLYGAAFRNIPRTDNVESHVPRPSLDSTLTALCQLTAIRMGAQRSMISLLDEERQHILAEATCDLPLQPDALGGASNTLWLGNVSIPRSWGICEKVLKLGPNVEPILVISDLTTDQRSCFREDVQSNPDMRFYASVALKSPNGAIVGTLCIFDNKSRDGLSKEQADLFKDLGSTVVNYLNTYTIRDQYRRGERFTRGLVSFAEGASALVPSEREVRQDSALPSQTSSDISSTTDKEIVSTDDAEKVHEGVKLNEITPNHPLSAISKTARAKSARHRSIRSLQDSILPNDSKSMFSRAANVIMGSSDLDGVLILDASVAASGGRRRANSASGSGTEAPSESYQSRSSSDDASSNSTEEHQRGSSSSSSKMCQLLGVATPSDKENPEYGTLLEPDLSRLFHEYPHGKIFTFCAEGHSLSSTEESTSNLNDTENLSPATSSKRKTNGRPQRGSTAIQAMFPKARSVAFVPFWDFERARWFAGCLCWSNDAYRLLSASVDLAYFKIFSHSIMRELSRLDAVALNQAKTTFVASISHELRSPLHGILGTLEFIKDTPLDSFQTSMMNSLHACGSTLLDTINHVMDYAKISDAKKSVSSKRLKNANTIRLSSKPLKNRRRKDPAFDLTIATEEVVEAVFSGSSYIPVTSKLVEAPSSPTDEYAIPFPQRKARFIILDMAYDDDWVRQIIDTNGGKVEVSSDPQVGTKLIVKLALTRPEAPVSLTAERAQYLSHLPRLKGRRICILRKKIAGPSENTSVSKTDEGLLRFTNALAYTLETQLKMQVVKTTEWEGHHADIVICPELSFDYLATIRKRRAHGQRAPVTVFVGMDALEAATLRSDARVTNRESVVEIITQPCGPYKLAYVINRCLDRFDHPAENLQYTAPTSQLLQPLSQEIKQHTYPSSPTNSLQSTLESLNSDASGPVASSTAGSTTAQPSVTSPTEEEDPVISHTLIVDDNLLNRRLLIAYMKKNGLQFEEASNGQEALDKYREGSRKFDVILMDMSMPVMDGMSATRAIREYERDNNMPRCSIVALTGLVSSSAKLEAWSSGIDHFMTKPVNFKALGELLKNDETRRHTRMRSTGIIRDAANITSEDGQAT
ncbi:unnamed protein product [Alternaria alternata]